MNMQHIEVTVARCGYRMKCYLIVDGNEKCFGGEKYWRRRIFGETVRKDESLYKSSW